MDYLLSYITLLFKILYNTCNFLNVTKHNKRFITLLSNYFSSKSYNNEIKKYNKNINEAK